MNERCRNFALKVSYWFYEYLPVNVQDIGPDTMKGQQKVHVALRVTSKS